RLSGLVLRTPSRLLLPRTRRGAAGGAAGLRRAQRCRSGGHGELVLLQGLGELLPVRARVPRRLAARSGATVEVNENPPRAQRAASRGRLRNAADRSRR